MSTPPKTRPKSSRAEVETILAAKGVTSSVALLGVRGYYTDLGAPGVNDRGIWDDAFFVVTPRVFEAFRGNTDPSVSRPGIAVLKPGIWRYRPGRHKIASPNGYPAFVQAGPVTVHRDGGSDDTGRDDTGWFGINIHHGGNGTSSLGCQTVVPGQWDRFRELLYVSLREFRQPELPYLLITEESRRRILGLAGGGGA